MAEIISLNKARKAKARADKTVRAQENRVKFGRTKAQRQADAADRARADKRIDDSRREN